MLQTPKRIPLNVPPFGAEEVAEAIDSLQSGWLTMGKKVKRCEELWAEYVGMRYGVMTNSGSSANLIALSVLRWQGRLQAGDEVITPALTWATTVFPIAQVGCVPVLVDVRRETYNIDPEAIVRAITPKTKAIMPVHLLGNPCDMTVIMGIAKDFGLYLIEDACEAHGAKRQSRNVGSFGELSTFSFFFSHHISTIEGGMVLTNDHGTAELLRAVRAFGWAREFSDKDNIAARYPGIDPRFLFLYPGFNVRPTEIQGAFGMHQIPKLEGFIQQRRETATYWNKALAPLQDFLLLPQERLGTRHAWFAYPFQVREGAPFTAKQLMAHLEENGVEARPIEAGNIAIQPAMRHVPHRISGSLANAQYVHDNAFFIGNHSGIGPAERETIVMHVEEFMRGHGCAY